MAGVHRSGLGRPQALIAGVLTLSHRRGGDRPQSGYATDARMEGRRAGTNGRAKSISNKSDSPVSHVARCLLGRVLCRVTPVRASQAVSQHAALR